MDNTVNQKETKNPELYSGQPFSASWTDERPSRAGHECVTEPPRHYKVCALYSLRNDVVFLASPSQSIVTADGKAKLLLDPVVAEIARGSKQSF